MVVFYLSKSLQIREDFVRTLKNYTFTNIYFWSVTKFLPSSRILWIPKGGRLLGATRMGTFIISQIVEYLYFSSHIFFIFFFPVHRLIYDLLIVSVTIQPTTSPISTCWNWRRRKRACRSTRRIIILTSTGWSPIQPRNYLSI